MALATVAWTAATVGDRVLNGTMTQTNAETVIRNIGAADHVTVQVEFLNARNVGIGEPLTYALPFGVIVVPEPAPSGPAPWTPFITYTPLSNFSVPLRATGDNFFGFDAAQRDAWEKLVAGEWTEILFVASKATARRQGKPDDFNTLHAHFMGVDFTSVEKPANSGSQTVIAATMASEQDWITNQSTPSGTPKQALFGLLYDSTGRRTIWPRLGFAGTVAANVNLTVSGR